MLGMGPRRGAAVIRVLGKGLLVCLMIGAAGLVVAGLFLYTDYGRDRLRAFLVSQVNQRLAATLEIGRLEGSVYGGVRLSDVRLTRDGREIFSADEVAAEYTIRELVRHDVLVRRIRLVNPRVVAARDPHGRWNLADLVRRPDAAPQAAGPARPVRLEAIEVAGADIVMESPLVFGAAHVPTHIASLDARMAFARSASGWRLAFTDLSFDGRDPDLSIPRLSGTIARDTSGWSLDGLDVSAERSRILVDGRIQHGEPHATIDLDVDASAFAFQEWAGVVHGLRRIAVDAAFTLRLQGPTDRLSATLDLRSKAGDVKAAIVLNGTVPGWRLAGPIAMSRLDLAGWLDEASHASSISGSARVDLNLGFNGGVPEGSYLFEGTHARYRGYEGTRVRARGTLAGRQVVIDAADATAYGATVRLSGGTIGYDDPQPFWFRGGAAGLDLRRLPGSLPVPHVESLLALDFDVHGRFKSPAIAGNAVFGPSTFLGASVGTGATGRIDTTATPLTYGGEGEVGNLSLERLAADLDIEWLDRPRYRGTVSGRFRVSGAGTDPATMALTGGGRLDTAALAGGLLSGAEVAISIADGSLDATYDGAFADVDPAVLFDDDRLAAALTGAGRLDVRLPGVLIQAPALAEVEVGTDLRLGSSLVRGVALDRGTLSARLERGTLVVGEAALSGPAFEGDAEGTLVLRGAGEGTLAYRARRMELDVLSKLFDLDLGGTAVAEGKVSGNWSTLQVAGTASASEAVAPGVRATSVDAGYTARVVPGDPDNAAIVLDARASLVEVSGRTIDEIDGTISYDAGDVAADLAFLRSNLAGRLAGSARLPGGERIDVLDLRLDIEGASWRLEPSEAPATVTWSPEGLTVSPVEIVNAADEAQRIALSGTWMDDGSGALQVTASAVALDSLPGLGGPSSPYGGLLTLDAVVTGTRERPIVTGNVLIVNGRIRQLGYERFFGRIEYVGGMFEVGVQMNQSAGAWLNASGAVPLGLIDRTQPERPIYLAVASTQVDLGLIEGLTGVVRDVTGGVELNLSVVGTSHEPRFTGVVALSGARFAVTATGARYRRGEGIIDLTRDRIAVRGFRIEDSGARILEITGSVGTSELQLQDLALEVAARGLEVLRNAYGTMSADARLTLRGRLEAPEVAGTVTVTGGQLRADRILDRVLFQPYALEGAAEAVRPVDALSALNPWDRLAMDIAVEVPGALRLTGDNVQIASGTPLGLGNIDLRVAGNLRLRKAPRERLTVTGALDQITGRYAFQGRRFDLDPASSIAFRGDLAPELRVTVHRVISGVEVRVAITGPLSDPALQLSSTPPLDSSDILSLIVFNTTANQLSLAQQEQLAVRAGTLAAGFLAAPLVTALERSLGIDLFEIEAPDAGGARVTIGDEIAPGLVARFSRQFGPDEYDEATLEYYLSRLFRIRATFSDAGSPIRSPFRRVERAGVDLLLFFSF
jgi:translocation and assembly module TamB